MKRATVVIALTMFLCSTAFAIPVATVHRQEPIKDANLTVLTIEVVSDNGTIYPFRTKIKGTLEPTKDQLTARKALLVQMVVDMESIVPEEMVPKSEIDSVLAKLKAKGKIDSDTWEDVQAEAVAVVIGP